MNRFYQTESIYISRRYFELQQKMILNQIIEVARKNNLAELISGEHFYARILQNRNKKPTDIEREGLTIQLPMDISEEDKSKITSITQEVKAKLKSGLEIQFEQSIGVGNKLPNFGEIKKVFEEGTAELSAKAGQVLLIDVWATWCGPCQKPMEHNQKMIEKNNWGENVRIVGVSVDQQLDTIKSRVQSKGWKSVEHLTLQGWKNDHPLIKSFAINGIPFVCLVDTKGTIVFTGHPSSINLQEKINSLLKGEEEKKEQKPEAKQGEVSEDEAKGIKQTFGNKQFFDVEFGKLDFISSKVVLKQSASKGKVSTTAEVTIYYYEQDKEFLEKCDKIIPKNGKFQRKVVQTEKIPPVPEHCFDCKGKLSYPLYWCRWGKNPQEEFRCRDCGEKKLDQTHYAYENNSILLMKETHKYFSAAKGENIQPAASLQELSPHGFGCNGCGGCPQKVGEARYICLGCRAQPNHKGDYVDLCQECVNKLIAKDQEVLDSLENENHKQDHCLLRVLYNVKGYYQY